MSFVESKKNPYLEILKDFKNQKINQKEFLLALYSKVCLDVELLKSYKMIKPPFEPPEHQKYRLQFDVNIRSVSDVEEETKSRNKYLTQMKSRFAGYYTKLEETYFTNKSNQNYLIEMREFLRDKNPKLADRCNQVLLTYGNFK